MASRCAAGTQGVPQGVPRGAILLKVAHRAAHLASPHNRRSDGGGTPWHTSGTPLSERRNRSSSGVLHPQRHTFFGGQLSICANEQFSVAYAAGGHPFHAALRHTIPSGGFNF